MKKYFIYMFAAVLLAAVSLPVRAAAAGAFQIDGAGTVSVTSPQAAQDKASTFQFSLSVDSPDAARVEFRFRENLAKVQEFRYDPGTKRLSVYVAAEGALFASDTAALAVGQVVALDGGGNAAAAYVSVVENSFQYVYGTELKQEEGMQLPGTVQIGRRDPVPEPPQDDEDDDDDDDDDWQDDDPGDDGQPEGDGNAGGNPPPEGSGNVPVTNPPQGGTGNPVNTPVPQITAPPQGGTGNPVNTPMPQITAPPQGGSAGSPVNTPVPQKTAPPQGGSAGNPVNTPVPQITAPPQGGSNGPQGSDNPSSVETSGKADGGQDKDKSDSGVSGILLPVLVVVLVIVTVLVIGFAVATVAGFNRKKRR